VVALGHVVNYDVPAASEDYIHRVGRTGRAELTGEAFTFVAPEDEGDFRAIERAIGKPLPRVLLPDFDYRQRPPEAPAPAALGRHAPPPGRRPVPHGRRPPPHPPRAAGRPGGHRSRRPPGR
jgi:ATP-dependent RNA helicase RhlE